MKLSSMLKSLLKERKITLTELARKSGVKQPTLFGWSQGRSVQNIDDLKKVSAALDVSIHYLLYGEPDPHETPGQEILKELFSGDVRITVNKIERKR